ncbi:hypothetical protein GQ53DRAFT_206688 [Thozetella sp. PMI_491]|nr:hypothetical protein GQ53DRAFT_206688 [Thozetella sp. PMI_491]
MASSATPQSYNATAYPYQQQSGTYHRGPAEENRSAPSAYQQPLNPAVDNQHHHSPAKAQQPFHTHVEQRRVSDQPAPLAPAQPKIPSHYVLPSQRDPSELVGRHGAQEQRYGPTSNLMPAPQPVAEAEERGAVERQAIAPSRRSSGVSDGLAGTQDTMASRVSECPSMYSRLLTHASQTKRKADEAVPSPEGSVLKRTRGMDATFDADRLRRPRTAGRDAAGGQGVSQSPQSQSARKPSAGESRTTTFDEVYQDGNPRYKHLIVEFPASSNRFYILRCDDHGVHFNASNPLAGAAKHLASTQHGNMTKEHANAIERLGWRIVDCTPEKANVNNEMVKLAFQAGYKAFNRNFLTKKDRKSLEGNGATEGLPAPHREMPSGRRVSSRKQEASARKQPVPVPIAKRTPELVTDPAPGELYRAFWSEEKRNYAVVVLPWGDLSRVGFNGTLATTGLLDRAPKCYVIDRMVPKILGWSAGFEDGGSLVDKREFPVCYFDNRS